MLQGYHFVTSKTTIFLTNRKTLNLFCSGLRSDTHVSQKRIPLNKHDDSRKTQSLNSGEHKLLNSEKLVLKKLILNNI